MKTLKFGGTSLANASRMQQVASIVIEQLQESKDSKVLVVLSAVAGTTDSLCKLVDLLKANQSCKIKHSLKLLKNEYFDYVDSLLSAKKLKQEAIETIELLLNQIERVSLDEADFEPKIIATGELISTKLFYYLMLELNYNACYLASLEHLRLGEDNQPDEAFIKEKLQAVITTNSDAKIFIAQGFICRTASGQISNLKRGGSDYTASLFAAAIKSEEVQIWTDIDGMHNNDPRYVTDTKPIRSLSFNEAAELAYFGAKILHPSSIKPARKNNIPVRLLNTLEPSALGTVISNNVVDASGISPRVNAHVSNSIKSIAAKDNITAIKIRSSEMLQAPGFLRKIFEVFELYQTSIDVITTSEVAVSLTIDDTTHLDAISKTLTEFADVDIDRELTIVCVVGELLSHRHGIASKILFALKNIPIRMISYGGSPHNMTLLIEQQYKAQALIAMHKELF